MVLVKSSSHVQYTNIRIPVVFVYGHRTNTSKDQLCYLCEHEPPFFSLILIWTLSNSEQRRWLWLSPRRSYEKFCYRNQSLIDASWLYKTRWARCAVRKCLQGRLVTYPTKAWRLKFPTFNRVGTWGRKYECLFGWMKGVMIRWILDLRERCRFNDMGQACKMRSKFRSSGSSPKHFCRC